MEQLIILYLRYPKFSNFWNNSVVVRYNMLMPTLVLHDICWCSSLVSATLSVNLPPDQKRGKSPIPTSDFITTDQWRSNR
jgi:hypothetical protein